ncbi:MAG: hypothetical protein ACRCXC_06585 [Legionella sp.]
MMDLNNILFNTLEVSDLTPLNCLSTNTTPDDEILTSLPSQEIEEKTQNLFSREASQDPKKFFLLLTNLLKNMDYNHGVNHENVNPNLTQITQEMPQPEAKPADSVVEESVGLDSDNDKKPMAEIEDNVAIVWINSEHYKPEIVVKYSYHFVKEENEAIDSIEDKK